MPMEERTARVAWWLGAAVTAVVLTLLHLGATVQWIRLDTLARFAAFEPFQHRVLVPALAAAGLAAFPGVQAIVWYAAIEAACWMACFALARKAIEIWTPWLSAGARRLLSLTVAWPVAVHLVQPQSFELVRADGALCRLEAWDLNFARVTLTPNLYYPYDLPGAVLTLLLAVLIVQYHRLPRARTLALYGLALAAAAVNRESAGLFVLALAVLTPPHPRGRYWAILAGHLAVVAAAVSIARWLVAPTAQPNPLANIAGSAYEFHLLNNVRTLLHPTYAIWVVPLFAGGLWVPLLAWRRRLAPDLRRLLWAFVVPSVAVAVLFGQILEHRVFIEAQPLVWIAAVQVMAAAVSSHRAAGAETQG